MIETIHQILTNPEMRDNETIVTHIEDTTNAGAAWFN
jgi:hypothetical protein